MKKKFVTIALIICGATAMMTGCSMANKAKTASAESGALADGGSASAASGDSAGTDASGTADSSTVDTSLPDEDDVDDGTTEESEEVSTEAEPDVELQTEANGTVHAGGFYYVTTGNEKNVNDYIIDKKSGMSMTETGGKIGDEVDGGRSYASTEDTDAGEDTEDTESDDTEIVTPWGEIQ